MSRATCEPFSRLAAMEGRTLAKAVAISVTVSERVIPAWPSDGDEGELDASPMSSEGAKKRVVLVEFLRDLFMATEVHVKADVEEDEGLFLAVE